jgi:hypothetical protein
MNKSIEQQFDSLLAECVFGNGNDEPLKSFFDSQIKQAAEEIRRMKRKHENWCVAKDDVFRDM